jgi:histone H3/H4
MPKALNIERDKMAQELARAEVVRLERMHNQALWDKDIADEHREAVLSYLKRKAQQATALATKGVIEE